MQEKLPDYMGQDRPRGIFTYRQSMLYCLDAFAPSPALRWFPLLGRSGGQDVVPAEIEMVMRSRISSSVQSLSQLTGFQRHFAQDSSTG